MAVNPDSIPRYAQPSPDELTEMYRDPTPQELLCDCAHRGACVRLLELWAKIECETDERRAWYLGCADCDEWEE